MSDEDQFDDRPWTEAQWERFLQKSDARSAKFGELLETFMDHPDRDAIIEREMGWDLRESGGEDADDDAGLTAEADDAADEGRSEANQELIDDEELDEIMRQDHEALENMPAYSRAFQFGLRVHDDLHPYFVPDEEDQDEDLIDAVAGGFTIAAKLAGAHGIGYEDDALCGNIVVCKRSLSAAQECLRGLRSLRTRNLVPPEVLDHLIEEGEQVQSLVEAHIAELRSRVWWE